MNEIWYYEYIVKVFNSTDNIEEIFSGVIPAYNVTGVAEELEDYYGNDLMEIQMIKPVFEGPVFEFQYASKEKDFDFTIVKKL